MVEIILIRYNLKDIEDKAISCIKKNTKYPYELTLFDNYKEKINLGKLWNKLIKDSDCEYICLLNSDAFVSEGWLTEMIKGFNDDVAIVGPSTNYCLNCQKITREKANENRDQYEEIDGCSGFCYLLKKSVWEEVGGFPEDFGFYGQESAFGLKVKKFGYKQVWAKGAWVEHLGHASSSKAEQNNEFSEVKERHFSRQRFARFKKKWDTSIKPKCTEETLKKLEEGLDKNRFAYVRFGDGDLLQMQGWYGRNDNQFFSLELLKEKIESFQIVEPDYIRSVMAGTENEPNMTRGVFARYAEDSKYQSIIKKYTDNFDFYNPIALHYLMAFYPEKVVNFIKKLQSKKVIFVGGEHLHNEIIQKVFNVNQFIETFSSQAYEKIDKWYPQIPKNGVILLAVGRSSGAVQKRLWNEKCKTVTFDIGSLADWLSGIRSRTWIWKTENKVQNFIKRILKN